MSALQHAAFLVLQHAVGKFQSVESPFVSGGMMAHWTSILTKTTRNSHKIQSIKSCSKSLTKPGKFFCVEMLEVCLTSTEENWMRQICE